MYGGYTAHASIKLVRSSIWSTGRFANCGVSSLGCRRCYRYGLPPNLYDLVQEMGRVNRLLDGHPGEHGYHVYLNVSTFLSLWIRSQRQVSVPVRNRNEAQLYEVLRFLILPTGCYHDAIEGHLEEGGCWHNCTGLETKQE